ncbi:MULTISPECIES: GntR family transcriptional regulator [unclassified Mesorhizobium]|uniref:GntR family transcriptional regulator n=1 Tax=unclassified Mesorhizobium TaxID=325217 RepID=UPI002414F17A|nr:MULTISPECIES: GntR family transcriptional regulator [unclassified Mesorhizobium]MDG4889916.1 GntR family transcriptional regulator [Mesorhizobium sp. WSM4887]MDG4904059.1 GntR family transcriptional regulator [Mesorhizobium sp. WSM4962]MDG4909086.1 GntR family transcriptional regulator [Mesorhizobium sp. WSM4898]MDG4921710.1 GntR family transcriptional regulator [Mesorhizobium sp. WSM4989]
MDQSVRGKRSTKGAHAKETTANGTTDDGPKKETGSSRVYLQLRQDILRVKINPGAALDEVRLSERFNLSRSPIREALVRLSSEGLVQILPNRSTIVAPLDIQAIPDFLDALDLLQRVTHRSAAHFRTEKDIETLVATQRGYEEAAGVSLETGDSLPMIEANYAFHMAVSRAGRNRYFTAAYQRLLDEGRRILHFHFEFERRGTTVEKLAQGHTDIVEAIVRRDADAAEQAAHLHAEQFRGRFVQYLNRSVASEMRLAREGD